MNTIEHNGKVCPIILAQDAQENVPYLEATDRYKVVVLKKHGNPSEGYVSSVIISTDKEPNNRTPVSGSMKLIEYSPDLHIVTQKTATQTVQQSSKNDTTTVEKPSKVIEPRKVQTAPQDGIPGVCRPLMNTFVNGFKALSVVDSTALYPDVNAECEKCHNVVKVRAYYIRYNKGLVKSNKACPHCSSK